MRQFVGACWLVLGLACRGDDWVVAGELPRATEEEPTGSDLPLVIDTDSCPSLAEEVERRRASFAPSQMDPTFVGRWLGELTGNSAAGFPTDRVELRLEASGTGTLRFDTALLSPGEEVQTSHICANGSSLVPCGSPSRFVGDFEYPTEALQTRESVLSFSLVTADPWGTFCAQQTPVAWQNPGQACGLSFDVQEPGVSRYSPEGCWREGADGAEDIDCALMYALDFCDCARDGCFASFAQVVDVGLQLADDGAALRGLLWWDGENSAAQIELVRAP